MLSSVLNSERAIQVNLAIMLRGRPDHSNTMVMQDKATTLYFVPQP
jgi:hypothetical protein